MKLTLVQTRADDGGGKPMFNVCCDGAKVGEVYYNMTGFNGYFKLPHKPNTGFNLGEGSLARVKRELAEFQRDYQPQPPCNKCGKSEFVTLSLPRDCHTHICSNHEQDLFFTPSK